MRASLIIPTYKREARLVECIQCALAQSHPDTEIVVIDQTTDHQPATAAFIDSIRGKIVYQTPDFADLVLARNLGLRTATGEALIFVDDDTRFDTNFVAAHVAALSGGVDVVQGRILEPNSGVAKRPQWLRWYCKFTGSDTCDYSGPTNTLTGANFSLTRKAQQIVGFFDENLTGSLLRDDSDYGVRCHKAGLTMRFIPEAEVFHYREPTGGVDANVVQPARILEPSVLRNDLYFVGKHFSK
ncbi:MAG TPA: glycosyltransferase, partial [candidate division Zixibacteria bacterium]|nr:glycosyltransferase [candidate division Zixibacteria bacterium]